MRNEPWLDTAKSLTPGVPALKQLNQMRSMGLSETLTTALAAAGYRLKYGESVSLQVPIFSPDNLSMVIAYLHSCRMDALSGLVRATWFSSRYMPHSPDLLVWTRALKQKKYLSADPMLQLKHIGLNRNVSKLEKTLSDSERILRTIVCQPDGATREFTKILRRYVFPFAILIDASPFGYRDRPETLVKIMREQFPGVPLIVLSNVGDNQMAYSCAGLSWNNGFPVWRAGQCDKGMWKRKKSLNWTGTLALLPDGRLNDRLLIAGDQVWKLHKLLPEALFKQASFPLFRVYNTLLTLCMPVEFHELQSDISRRGGLFPSKPMSDWLRKARSAKLNTGEAQIALEVACKTLEDLIEFIGKGTTGKQQALAKWIHRLLTDRKTGRVLVRGEREAVLLRKWLLTEYAKQVHSGDLDVIGVGSCRELYRAYGEWDRILIVGKLTPADIWSVGMGKELAWLTYPCELSRIEKLSQSASITANSPNDGKMAWWMLEKQGDIPLMGEPLPVDQLLWRDCSGQYVDHRNVAIEMPEDTTWLESLFADLDWEGTPEEVGSSGTFDISKVLVRTNESTYHYDLDTRLDVLTEDHGVIPTCVQDVQVGDNVLMLHGEDCEHFSPLEIFFESIPEEADKIEMYRKVASRWLEFLDLAISNNQGIIGLQKKMSETGVTTNTLRHWVRRNHVVQKHRQIMVAKLAELSGMKPGQKDLDVIINALGKLQGMYIKAGKALRKAAVARVNGADEIEVFGQLVPIDLIDDVLSIENVLHVSIPEQESKNLVKENLYDASMGVIEASSGKLTITSKGKNSLKQCTFANSSKVLACLNVMRDELHDVYANGSSLQKAIDELRIIGIDFSGGTSEVTQGKFSEYQRVHNGKNIDIGKHLGIGDSRSPERCFRLHFHWEEDEKALVIHHAGRHLPTSTG
jgi:hypothetical protein